MEHAVIWYVALCKHLGAAAAGAFLYHLSEHLVSSPVILWCHSNKIGQVLIGGW